MAVLNAGFEDAGTRPEIGRYWALTSFVALRSVAGFGASPALGFDDFERWSRLELEIRPAQRAFFDPRPEALEDFEEGWLLQVTDWDLAVTDRADWGGAPAEDFERGWDNEPLRTDWKQATRQPALFGTGRVETFEADWRSNGAFVFAWGAADTEPLSFGADSAETFERAWPAATNI